MSACTKDSGMKEEDELVEALKDPVYVEQFITASVLMILEGSDDKDNS